VRSVSVHPSVRDCFSGAANVARIGIGLEGASVIS